MAPPTNDDLNKLKKARSSKKRAVTISYNILEQHDILENGLSDQDKVTYERLKMEFGIFAASHDDYINGLEETDGYQDDADWKTSATYYNDVHKKVYDMELKVQLASVREKFEEDFEIYKIARTKVHKTKSKFNDKSDEDLKKSENVDIYLESLDEEYQNLNDKYDRLWRSVKEVTKVCKSLKRNVKLETEAIEFDASLEDVTDAHDALLRLRSAVRAQTVEKEQVRENILARERVAAAAQDHARDRNAARPSAVKLDKVENLKFNGEYRSWSSFVKEFKLLVYPDRSAVDIGVRIKQAIPTRFKHLLDNIEIHKYEEMMETLEAKFGNKHHIISSCCNEIENMTKPATDEAFITMTEKLENIQRDCVAVGLEKELDHSEVVKKVVARLPDLVKSKWFDYCLLHGLLLDGKNTEGIFQKLLAFMKGMKQIADFVVGDPSTSSGNSNSKSKFCSVTAVTSEPASSYKVNVQNDTSKKKLDPCLACHKEGAVITDEVRHLTNRCEIWKGLSMEARKKLVKCRKHPFAKDGHSFKDCDKPANYPCRKCQGKDHTALLCDKTPSKSACKSVSTELIDSSLETVMCCKSLVKTLVVKGKTEEEDLGIMEDNCSTDSFVLTVKAAGPFRQASHSCSGGHQ